MDIITKEAAQAYFDAGFNSWIKALKLTIEDIRPGFVRMRMPVTDAVRRSGGMVCGQAIMALADTAMVFATASTAGRFIPMTSVRSEERRVGKERLTIESTEKRYLCTHTR